MEDDEIIKGHPQELDFRITLNMRTLSYRKTPQNKLPDKIHYREGEYYHVASFIRVQAVRRTVKTLKHAIALMERAPNKQTLKKIEMTRAEYLDFYFGSFLVGMSTLYDSCLHLVNTICNTGLQGTGTVNEKTVLNHIWVARFGLQNCLKPIRKTILSSIPQRNLLVHESIMPDSIEELKDLYIWEGLYESEKLLSQFNKADWSTYPSKRKGLHPEVDILFAHWDARDKLREKLGTELKAVELDIQTIFSRLIPVYTWWCKAPAQFRAPAMTTKNTKSMA